MILATSTAASLRCRPTAFRDEELRVFAERVRTQLLRVADVAKVELFGVQAEKIFVEISQKRLAALGLDFNQVIGQLAAQNAVEGAGLLDAGTQNFQVRVQGALRSVDDLRRFPIRAVNSATGQASTLTLGDIADIRRGTIDPPAVKVRHQGKQVIALGVSMAKGGDIVNLGQALQARVAQLRADLPAGITLEQVQDQPAAVTRSVNEFVKVLIEAVVVVLLVSFLSLGLHTRPGFLSSASTSGPAWWWASPSRWCWPSPSSPCSIGAWACTRSAWAA